jgi:NADPH2:quinone reductase
MKSMFSIAAGGPETLVLTETDTPAPQAGQVRVQVKVAGVNFPDTLIIRDLYQFKPPRPFAPGSEVAGVIEAIGPDVTVYQIGDRVMALGRIGGFATHMIVPVSGLVPMPNTMPFDEAACFIFTYGTSHYALRDRAKLRAGETLLVLGATGGGWRSSN